MDTKRIIGFIMGVIALGLQIPGMLLLFSSPGGWNIAVVILAVLMLASAVFTVIAAIFSIMGNKKAMAMFICAGIGGALALVLLIYLLMTLEFAVIAAALSAIILFVSAKVVSAARR
jgi:hypothetical protein